jgi:anti-sigma factor RsiW
VTDPRCDHVHGLMALRAVGQLEPEDAVVLDAHLDGCAACRAEAFELAGVASALPMADPDRIGDDEPAPAALSDAVLGQLQRDGNADRRRSTRRRRRHWAAAGGVVGAVAAALVVLLVLVATGGSGSTPGRTVALHGPHGVHASAVLVAEPWGTEVSLSESGQAPGEVMWLSMGSDYGNSSWVGGSYTTVANRSVSANFPCALPPDRITHLWVRDAKGRTVLWSNAI